MTTLVRRGLTAAVGSGGGAIRTLQVMALMLIVAIAPGSPAAAVTGGRPDNGAHPQVGLVLAPGVAFCSGPLIAPTVVLTAAHCTTFFDAAGVREVQVSFDDQVTDG
jgi:hypothetical protein